VVVLGAEDADGSASKRALEEIIEDVVYNPQDDDDDDDQFSLEA